VDHLGPPGAGAFIGSDDMNDRARFQLGAGYPVVTAVVASVPPGVRVCPRWERVVTESLMLAQELAVAPLRIRGLDDRRSRERTNEVLAHGGRRLPWPASRPARDRQRLLAG
jgi:hypothetical protein